MQFPWLSSQSKKYFLKNWLDKIIAFHHKTFHFHNSVNLRSKKEYQPHSILDKYKKINFELLLKSWDYHFSFGNDIQRNDFMAKRNLITLKQILKNYFIANHHKFLMT